MIPSVGVDVLVSLGDRLTAPLKDIEGTIAKASERMNKRLELSMKLGMTGQSVQAFAGQMQGIVSQFTDSIREVERATGELATLGVKDLDAVVQRGYEMQTQLAGITADAFVRAAYDIKSGISGLTDQGVADMTAAAMLVAKATKGQAEQMTSLFATSYGIFKEQYAAMSDADFGNMFGAALSASVQQFKTDGAAMQQAIETAGAGAVNLGMQMTEQLTLLGMMQQQMQAGEAGTALRAFATNAARAHEKFSEMAVTAERPVRVRILDENGQLRAMPDILTDLRARYGETLDAFEAAEIKDAFGTDEAMKMINALYGQEAAVRANAEALGLAADKGAEFTLAMAKAADRNWDATLLILGQKIDVLKKKIGDRLLPVVEKFVPVMDAFLVKAFDWIDANPELVTGIGAVVAGLGALAAIVAPVLLGASTLVSTWAMMSYGATRLGLAVAGVGKWVAGAGRWLLWLGRLVLPLVGKAIMFIGRALIANPIGAIIMGIAVAAFLIYKYWEPISEFFQKLWDDIIGLFERGKSMISDAISGLTGFDWSSLLSVEGLSAAWAGITRFAGQWFGLLWDALSPLSWFGLVKSEDLATAWAKVTEFVAETASKVWEAIKSINWPSFVSLDTLKAAWAALTAWLSGVVGLLWEGIKFIAWADFVALTALTDAWAAVTGWIAGKAAELWSDITAIDWSARIGLDALGTAWAGVTAFFGNVNWKGMLPDWDWTAIIPFYDLGQRMFFGDQTPTRGASGTWDAPASQIADPTTLLKAAEASTELEARFPAITAAATETLTAVRDAITQLAALLQATDFTAEGERIASSIAAGIRAQIGEVRAAAEAMSATIRSALPGNAIVNVALSGPAAAPVQPRAGGGWFKPGWLLTGENGPELRYATEGGFIAHNRALRGMLDMASRTRDLVGGVSLETTAAGSVPALATVTAPGPATQRGPITLAPQYNIQMSFDGNVDMDEVRATVRAELEAAEERAQLDLRSALYD